MKLLTPRKSSTPRATVENNSWTRKKAHWNGVKAALAAVEKAKTDLVRPLDLVGGRDKPFLPALPPSVAKAEVPFKNIELVQSTYHWAPIQVKEHGQPVDDPGHTLGTYVNTLTYNIKGPILEGAKPLQLRLEPKNFTPQGSCWCYLIGGSFVVCKGVIIGRCPKMHDPENGRNMRIARLPVEGRPRKLLTFAAMSREAYDVGGHITYASSLVHLTVDPDGWICGRSTREMEGAIDLSAVRFCIQGGISLMDEVSVHTVDVADTRLVCIQGTCSDRFHTIDSAKALGCIPESCRPNQEGLAFVTAGSGPGAFNLMTMKKIQGGGIGAELFWKDGIWNRDGVSVSGVMYEVSKCAMPFSLVDASWSPFLLRAFVTEFQKFLIAKFGSVEDAWDAVFDLDGSGGINFTEFAVGCKAAGYVGNATRLWAALDEDHGGFISLEELCMDFSDGVEQDVLLEASRSSLGSRASSRAGSARVGGSFRSDSKQPKSSPSLTGMMKSLGGAEVLQLPGSPF
eukprot:TRINITY_DN15119_c0_g1_i1.p1 TRINITY_DN15119_c0_g1~~TRINITY_DN15119_c0_g1_i1.p1  ORF type:complete len:512 (+),score=87.59 TRINITY_DN15119_c0_g1_i1:127-1662(+)